MTGIFEDKDKARMCDEIAAFFKEEHDLELGVIGTGRILDFFQEMLGNRIYNKAQSSFMGSMRIIWKRITMRCIRM